MTGAVPEVATESEEPGLEWILRLRRLWWADVLGGATALVLLTKLGGAPTPRTMRSLLVFVAGVAWVLSGGLLASLQLWARCPRCSRRFHAWAVAARRKQSVRAEVRSLWVVSSGAERMPVVVIGWPRSPSNNEYLDSSCQVIRP
jgi:hypothetical protein